MRTLIKRGSAGVGTTEGPSPWAGVLLSDQEALQIIAVLADVHDGHQIDRHERHPPGTP
jgi:hypothetical protein